LFFLLTVYISLPAISSLLPEGLAIRQAFRAYAPDTPGLRTVAFLVAMVVKYRIGATIKVEEAE